MLRVALRHLFSRRLLASAANRYPDRLLHGAATSQNYPFTDEKSNEKTADEKANENGSIKLASNLQLEEILDFSTPKPFEEVPVHEEKGELHPADFIDDIGPPLPISFNLAAYVNESETLTKLVQLGVDLSEMDKDPKKAKYILKLDFERDIKDYIQFLHDHGVESDALGIFITKNPFIFKEDLENLEIRINYLKSKKFSSDAIARILSKNAFFLNYSTKTVDNFLGFIQKQFSLTGDEVRHVLASCPQLLTHYLRSQRRFMAHLFFFKEICGLSKEQMKKIFVAAPKLYIQGVKMLNERFDVIHNVMGIPQETIVEHPNLFFRRAFMLKERHDYLVRLDRAQYDPTKPNYVSLEDIATANDNMFCEKCAKTSVSQYNEFLKTR